MHRMITYEISANLDVLERIHAGGEIPETLEAPLRAMVSEIVSRAEAKPLSIYLCSSDRDTDSRNRFGYVLALAIQKRIPTALLVDCDFMSTGLSGVIPHRDALGFLDLLLYGTSLGVITQQTGAGVRVVGAGSFPVTRKSPFAMDAFENTCRYLSAHAKSVVYCGPLLDDDEAIHGIAERADLVMMVNVGEHFREGTLDALETRLASLSGPEAWSIRMNTRLGVGVTGDEVFETAAARTPESPTPAPPPSPEEEEETAAIVAEVEGIVGEERRTESEPPMEHEPEVPTRTAKPWAETKDAPRRGYTADGLPPGASGRRRGSLWLRVVTPIVGVCLIAFVVWWLYLTKSVRDRETPPTDVARETPVTEPERQPADTVAVDADTVAVVGTPVRTEAGAPDATEPAEPVTETPDSAYTNGVRLAERLDAYANQYLVHVSSFRRLDNAREEALYLMGWGYPVFLYRIDLGGKGIWYRVYVGPAATREEAREFKIKLDENPRIQSTRIARVPG